MLGPESPCGPELCSERLSLVNERSAHSGPLYNIRRLGRLRSCISSFYFAPLGSYRTRITGACRDSVPNGSPTQCVTTSAWLDRRENDGDQTEGRLQIGMRGERSIFCHAMNVPTGSLPWGVAEAVALPARKERCLER